ncbi:dispanin subfamily A member 2b-like [Narcine bancroftii]|uniref:dispanin subfamily A member 2b-like n=1 Tax=Narcine bancroftii TaxID=1343680 RepID=UPI0038319990
MDSIEDIYKRQCLMKRASILKDHHHHALFSLLPSGKRQQQKMEQRIENIQLPEIERVETYMSWSVFNLIFCFFPLGLVALIFSCKVDIASRNDDQESAMQSSFIARLLNLISTLVGIIIFIIIITIKVYWS